MGKCVSRKTGRNQKPLTLKSRGPKQNQAAKGGWHFSASLGFPLHLHTGLLGIRLSSGS